MIDPRIKHVGTSKLRQMNTEFLSALGDEMYVIQESDKPIAVLVSYELFLEIQQRSLDQAERGRLGGQSTSMAKAKAARRNGKKGGRPKRAPAQAEEGK